MEFSLDREVALEGIIFSSINEFGSLDKAAEYGFAVVNGKSRSLDWTSRTTSEADDHEEVHLRDDRRMISVSTNYAVKYFLFEKIQLVGVNHLNQSTAILILAEDRAIIANIPTNPETVRFHDAIDRIRYLYDREMIHCNPARITAWWICRAGEGRPAWHNDLKLAVLRHEIGLAPKRKYYDFVDFERWDQTREPILLIDATTEKTMVVKLNGVDVTGELKHEWLERERLLKKASAMGLNMTVEEGVDTSVLA